jgi:hypothetical protein
MFKSLRKPHAPFGALCWHSGSWRHSSVLVTLCAMLLASCGDMLKTKSLALDESFVF